MRKEYDFSNSIQNPYAKKGKKLGRVGGRKRKMTESKLSSN